MFRLVDKLSSRDLLILGDLNIDVLSPPSSPPSSDAKAYLRTLRSSGLRLLTDSTPTHLSSSNPSLLDHLVTNVPERFLLSGVVPTSFSDHFLTFACLRNNKAQLSFARNRTPTVPTTEITTRDVNRLHPNSFLGDLSRTVNSLVVINPELSADDTFSAFHDAFVSCVNRHAPIVTKRLRPVSLSPPYLDGTYKTLAADRDHFRLLSVRNPSNLDYRRLYTACKNRTTSYLRTAKSTFYKERLAQSVGNPSKIWRILTSATGTRKPTSETCPHAPADVNNYFTSSASTLLTESYGDTPTDFPALSTYLSQIRKPPDELIIPPLSHADFDRILRSLPNGASAGYDRVSPAIFKLSCQSHPFRNYLVALLNLCISQSAFPSALKTARLCPVPKGGSPLDLSNFRPISVLPVFDKVLELHMLFCIERFISSNDLLYSKQSGFRKGHSCSSILSFFTDHILSRFNAGELVGAAFLDFSKAFDTISHEILLFKLSHYNFSPATIELIGSFLCNRKQFVAQGSNLSPILTNPPIGVPQGSSLGPLLFALYVNDLPLALSHAHMILYADDSTVFHSSSSASDLARVLNSELSTVSSWCTANRMVLNPKKSKIMLLGSLPRLRAVTLFPPIYIHNTALERVENFKLLGFTIDSHLNFQPHVENVIRRANQGLLPIRRARDLSLPLQYLRLLYYSLIHPHILYCLPVYSSCSDANLLSRVNMSVKKAIKTIFRKHPRTPTSEILPLFNVARILPFQYLIPLSLLLHVYSTKTNPHYPSYFQPFSVPSHEHSTRFKTSGSLSVKFAATKTLQRSIELRSISVWNTFIRNFPMLELSTVSLYSFRRLSSRHLQSVLCQV
mgnify:CR=1 FL=1